MIPFYLVCLMLLTQLMTLRWQEPGKKGTDYTVLLCGAIGMFTIIYRILEINSICGGG